MAGADNSHSYRSMRTIIDKQNDFTKYDTIGKLK